MSTETRPPGRLAALNHDLRTPLNAILGFADLLAEADPLDPRYRRYARNIQESGRRLLATVESVLAQARHIEASEADRIREFTPVGGHPE